MCLVGGKHYHTKNISDNQIVPCSSQEMRLVSVKDQIGEMDLPSRPRQEESLKIKLTENKKEQQPRYNQEPNEERANQVKSVKQLQTLSTYVDMVSFQRFILYIDASVHAY